MLLLACVSTEFLSYPRVHIGREGGRTRKKMMVKEQCTTPSIDCSMLAHRRGTALFIVQNKEERKTSRVVRGQWNFHFRSYELDRDWFCFIWLMHRFDSNVPVYWMEMGHDLKGRQNRKSKEAKVLTRRHALEKRSKQVETKKTNG